MQACLRSPNVNCLLPYDDTLFTLLRGEGGGSIKGSRRASLFPVFLSSEDWGAATTEATNKHQAMNDERRHRGPRGIVHPFSFGGSALPLPLFVVVLVCFIDSTELP